MKEENRRQLSLWSVTWTLPSQGRDRPKKETKYNEVDQIKFYNEICSKWCFQLEAGEKAGTKHYQIQLNLKKKCTKHRLMRTFSDYFQLDEEEVRYLNFTPTSNNGEFKSFSYCMKKETRIEKYYCDPFYYYGKDLELFEKPQPFSGESCYITKATADIAESNLCL